jgi:hypothetical protein
MPLSPLPCYLALLDPNILLSTLFSNTLSLRSYLNISDQVSHTYKATDEIINIITIIIMSNQLANIVKNWLSNVDCQMDNMCRIKNLSHN